MCIKLQVNIHHPRCNPLETSNDIARAIGCFTDYGLTERSDFASNNHTCSYYFDRIGCLVYRCL
jgi:hypothetical protein